MREKILRIIDANFNRSREGARVCEEIARFALGSESLSRDLKRMRAGISARARSFERKTGQYMGTRDTREDIGRSSRLPGSLRRHCLRDVFAANIQRVKESLRVLEEFSRLIEPKASRTFARLRFKAYDIEQAGFRKIDALRDR